MIDNMDKVLGFASRLEKARGNMTIAFLARQAGINDRSLRTYIKGESIPNLENLVKLADTLKVNIQWLSTGDGPMRNEEEVFQEISNRIIIDSKEVRIPHYDIKVSAGHGNYIDEENIIGYIPFAKSWFSRFRIPTNKAVAFNATGDSMEPTIQDNALILVDTSEYKPRDGCIYVISTGGDLRVKRLQRQTKGLLIISDNPVYKEEMIENNELDHLTIIGRVVWTGMDL